MQLPPYLKILVESLEDRIDRLAAAVGGGGSGGPGPKTTFVFSPGNPGPLQPNQFTSWATLVAACFLTIGPKWVGIDISHGAATIPAGNWTMSTAQDVIITMMTPASGGGPLRNALTIADGAHFLASGGGTCILEFQHMNVFFAGVSSAPIELGSGGGAISEVILFRDAGIVATGGVPLVEVSGAGNTGAVRLYEGSTVAAGLGINAAGTSTMFVWLDTRSNINANTIGSAVGATVNLAVAADAGTFNRTQANLLGTTVVTLNSQLSYLVGNRVVRAAAAQAGVATPAGQVAGGAVSTNAPFALVTIVSQVAAPLSTGGKYRVHGSLEVKTSAATTDVTITITARATAGGGNFVAQYATVSNQGTAAAGGAKITVPFDVTFDGEAGGFPLLPSDVNGSTDVGIEVDVSGGNITTAANHGCLNVEETS